jgi:hypothetical protein
MAETSVLNAGAAGSLTVLKRPGRPAKEMAWPRLVK